MVSDPTFAMSRAMTPPSQNERTLMTASVMPMDGPVAQTMAHIAAAILLLRIWCHFLGYRTLEMGVLAPWRRKYANW